MARMVRMARWPEDRPVPTLPSFRPQIVSGTNVKLMDHMHVHCKVQLQGLLHVLLSLQIIKIAFIP